MRLFESFKIAIAMYSKIPVKQSDWKKENMRYAMCFFPLIGIVIGVFQWIWMELAEILSIGSLLYASVAVLIPVIITGGIHLDGFLDTMDALSSYQSKERKLEILSDPHTGAFAIIGGIAYFLLSTGLFSEVSEAGLGVIMTGYVLSRALSGFAVVTFTPAKPTGLVNTFSEASQKKRVRCVMVFFILLSMAAMIYFNPIYGIAGIIGAFLVFWYYARMSHKLFGGITGDLAGFFLQLCELVILGMCILAK